MNAQEDQSDSEELHKKTCVASEPEKPHFASDSQRLSIHTNLQKLRCLNRHLDIDDRQALVDHRFLAVASLLRKFDEYLAQSLGTVGLVSLGDTPMMGSNPYFL